MRLTFFAAATVVAAGLGTTAAPIGLRQVSFDRSGPEPTSASFTAATQQQHHYVESKAKFSAPTIVSESGSKPEVAKQDDLTARGLLNTVDLLKNLKTAQDPAGEDLNTLPQNQDAQAKLDLALGLPLPSVSPGGDHQLTKTQRSGSKIRRLDNKQLTDLGLSLHQRGTTSTKRQRLDQPEPTTSNAKVRVATEKGPMDLERPAQSTYSRSSLLDMHLSQLASSHQQPRDSGAQPRKDASAVASVQPSSQANVEKSALGLRQPFSSQSYQFPAGTGHTRLRQSSTGQSVTVDAAPRLGTQKAPIDLERSSQTTSVTPSSLNSGKGAQPHATSSAAHSSRQPDAQPRKKRVYKVQKLLETFTDAESKAFKAAYNYFNRVSQRTRVQKDRAEKLPKEDPSWAAETELSRKLAEEEKQSRMLFNQEASKNSPAQEALREHRALNQRKRLEAKSEVERSGHSTSEAND